MSTISESSYTVQTVTYLRTLGMLTCCVYELETDARLTGANTTRQQVRNHYMLDARVLLHAAPFHWNVKNLPRMLTYLAMLRSA
jgi:hypothetical protein